MKVRTLAAAGIAALLALGGYAAATDASSPAILRVTERSVDGAEVGYFEFSEPTARCPAGYVATGGGVSPGATEIAYEHATFDGRGWEAAGLNTSETGFYSTSVSVMCARGVRNLRVQISAAEDASAKRDLLAAVRNR